MKKRISKLRFGRLFYNDKFVMLLSIFVAFVLWLYVASTTQEASVFTVTDIPVSLPELSNDLKYFNSNNVKAEVRISGNAIVVATVTSDDIYITASDVSHITSPGNYIIDLVPKKSGLKTDYSFESTVSPSSISVYADRYAEKEFNITDKVIVSSVDETSYASQTVLSQQTVKLTGAETVINSIAEVCAEYEFNDTLSETTVVSVPLVFYDANGKEVDLKYVNADISKVDATVPVLKVQTVDVIPNLINVPDSLNLGSEKVKVTPSTVRIAVQNGFDGNIDSVLTDTIDFSQVNLSNNKFTVSLSFPSGVRNLDNIETADVEIDMSDMMSTALTLNKFSVINEGSDQTTTVSTQSITVTLIGDKDQISRISASNITAVIDMSSKSATFIGFTEMPVTIYINNKFDKCWVYGSYTVNVTATKKSETSTA